MTDLSARAFPAARPPTVPAPATALGKGSASLVVAHLLPLNVSFDGVGSLCIVTEYPFGDDATLTALVSTPVTFTLMEGDAALSGRLALGAVLRGVVGVIIDLSCR